MTWADRQDPHFGDPKIQHQPFSVYLAKQFIAKKGFEVASIPEVQELAAPGNILLTYTDGHAFTIFRIVDRETNPQAAFSLDVEKLRRIGEACLKYTGKINRAKMPVSIGIIEVGPGSADQPQRLGLLKRSTLRAKVLPFAVRCQGRYGAATRTDSRKALMAGSSKNFSRSHVNPTPTWHHRSLQSQSHPFLLSPLQFWRR